METSDISQNWYAVQMEIMASIESLCNSNWNSIGRDNELSIPFKYPNEKTEHINKLQKQFIADKVTTLAKLQEEIPEPLRNQDKRNWYSIELAMYRKLSFHLCYYFLGVSRPSSSVAVADLATLNSGGFPGGAFYFKLEGDTLRFERRQYDKKFRGMSPEQKQRELGQ